MKMTLQRFVILILAGMTMWYYIDSRSENFDTKMFYVSGIAFLLLVAYSSLDYLDEYKDN